MCISRTHRGCTRRAYRPSQVITRPKLHLSSLVSLENPTLRKLLKLPPPTRYELTQYPENADFVLFVESGYFGLEVFSRLYELKKYWKAQLFVFSESDWPFPLLPGLYPSLTKHVPWAHSWSFLMDEQQTTNLSERPYLFSFIGRSSTHPVRKEILNLDSDETPCVDLSAAPSRFPEWSYSETYARILGLSRFALCPRGIGVSSIRLFEAMRGGCVPVIISDDWIEPPCGQWRDFSIRVPESRVDAIPDVCLSRLSEAQEMGQFSEKAYREYFGPNVFLDNAVDFIRESSMSGPRGAIARTLSAVSLREFRDVLSRLKNSTLRFTEVSHHE